MCLAVPNPAQLSPNTGAHQDQFGTQSVPAVGNHLSAWPCLLVTAPAFSSTTMCPLCKTFQRMGYTVCKALFDKLVENTT